MKLYLPITVDLYNIYPLAVMNAQQYNTGRGALVTLTAGGSVIVPDAETLYVYAKKSDGTVVYANCSLIGNQIQVDYDEQMLAIAEKLQMELQMVDGDGNSVTTPIYMVNVQPSNIDYKKITSSDEFLALTQALADVEELKKNGLRGDKGDAATIEIGTVTASEPGSNPVVTDSGTSGAAVFNFVLPRGLPGPKGDPGNVANAIDPDGTTEEDIGKAADAYYTGLALRELYGKIDGIRIDSSKNIIMASGITAYHVRCTKYGNLCIGYFNCITTKAFAAGATIATLPYPASEWTLIPLPDSVNHMARGSVSAGTTALKIEQEKASGVSFISEFIWFTK